MVLGAPAQSLRLDSISHYSLMLPLIKGITLNYPAHSIGLYVRLINALEGSLGSES